MVYMEKEEWPEGNDNLKPSIEPCQVELQLTEKNEFFWPAAPARDNKCARTKLCADIMTVKSSTSTHSPYSIFSQIFFFFHFFSSKFAKHASLAILKSLIQKVKNKHHKYTANIMTRTNLQVKGDTDQKRV